MIRSSKRNSGTLSGFSAANWVLAAQVPGLANVKNKRTIEPTVEALMAAIESYRARAAKTGRKVQRIIATYEAGWSDEDARRLVRERSELIKERIKLANRIGAVLATLGVPEYDPLKRNRRQRLDEFANCAGRAITDTRAGEDCAHARPSGIGTRSDRL